MSDRQPPSPVARSWRPTVNLPLAHPLAQRRTNMRSGRSPERNRWLSEDEGTDEPVAGPSRTLPSTRDAESADEQSAGGTKRPIDRKVARARSRRAISSEALPTTTRQPPLPITALNPDIGFDPPAIQHLVPPPHVSSPATIATAAMALGSGGFLPSQTPLIPDAVPGRGRDGLGGPSRPIQTRRESAPMPSPVLRGGSETPNERLEREDEVLAKMRRILGCALCPPRPGNAPPPLHQPITLPCGHTLSSAHVAIPPTPAITLNPTRASQAEWAAAVQKQQQQRLAIWCSLACPLPSCKKHSPSAAVVPGVLHEEENEESISSGSQRRGLVAQGLAFYPPLPSTAPAAAPSAAVHSSPESGLLDTTIDKVLSLVLREIAQRTQNAASPRLRSAFTPTDSEATDTSGDEGDEEDSNSDGSPSFALLSQDRSPAASSFLPQRSGLHRTSSKRRRGAIPSPEVRGLPQARQGYAHGSAPVPGVQPDEWQFEKELLSHVECDVCALLLYEPVTTPCQHTFCSKCLARSLDHSSRCPLCRQDLPSFTFFQDHAVNKVLLSIIKTAFNGEYIERQVAIDRDERDARLDTPLFVCTLAFPSMPTILHVFEPRYRLMIRRCIESGNPRFGMLLPARGTGPPGIEGVSEYGTMLEIQSVQMLPDGRSMVETCGSYRFRLLEKGSLDGYTVGRIQRIDDISDEDEARLESEAAARAKAARENPAPALAPTPSSSGPPQIDTSNMTTAELMATCQSFINQLRSGSAPWLLQRLNNTYGAMPTDPSDFSYWMALVIPIDEYEKARLLPIRSPRMRLMLIVHWVESLRSSWWFSSGSVEFYKVHYDH